MNDIITVDQLTQAVRDTERAATEFTAEYPDCDRDAYAYAYLLGALQAYGVDVKTIREGQ